ncbi:Zn-ribbon domain-containing OB-fold protein [Georgenia ruanii]|uniref:DNA-binding protein n=1 Tax=Georgenia ruanii TaxID=348442 RepID=A0A7J9V3E5_9MICO|nr:OB-fold domain-containing protein [Georgenia ruanii]MPV90474.1 hypothetical protein [Georgenia ruanii]
MTDPRPVPALDLETRGFFEAAAEGRLAVRACTECGFVLHMPRTYCHRCGSWESEWRTVAGVGILYSWCVVEHQVHPAFPAPYTLVMVDLSDAPGTRLVGYLPGRPALAAGQEMRARFEILDEKVGVPRWETISDDLTRQGWE